MHAVISLPFQSSGEGFGFVFLEAMAFEKPVVGGAHGGTPDLIQDGLNGFLVPHGDAEGLTARSRNCSNTGRSPRTGTGGPRARHAPFPLREFSNETQRNRRPGGSYPESEANSLHRSEQRSYRLTRDPILAQDQMIISGNSRTEVS